jgi:hypothetical protein
MDTYPTAAQLDAMGATLERDVDLCTPALRRWFGQARTETERVVPERTEPRRIVAWPRKRGEKRIA